MTKQLQAPAGYADLLADIKTRVRTAQVRAAFVVSRELILLYWSIGRDILNRQQAEGWGTKVIERLTKDLGAEFPGVEGFSSRNLKYMLSLAEAWPEAEIVLQLVALLPWAISESYWTGSRSARPANGICARRSSTAGAATSWFIKSAVDCIRERGKRSRTLSRRFLLPIPI